MYFSQRSTSTFPVSFTLHWNKVMLKIFAVGRNLFPSQQELSQAAVPVESHSLWTSLRALFTFSQRSILKEHLLLKKFFSQSWKIRACSNCISQEMGTEYNLAISQSCFPSSWCNSFQHLTVTDAKYFPSSYTARETLQGTQQWLLGWLCIHTNYGIAHGNPRSSNRR